MPGGPDRGERGDTRAGVAARATPRLVAVGVMFAALAIMAGLAYDHRQLDLGAGSLALADGRTVTVEGSGHPGPSALVLAGRSSVRVRPLPPVLASSTSTRASRGPGGFAMSPQGWVLFRLAQRGRDTQGGQITEISPGGTLIATVAVLHWRTTAIVGVTDQGLAVFRDGTTLNMVGPEGEAQPLLDLGRLGVGRAAAGLVAAALAPDGRIAVLVADPVQRDTYLLFERRPGGAANHVTRIPGSDLLTRPTPLRRPAMVRAAVAFAGGELVVAGDSGLVRIRGGRIQARVKVRRDGRPLRAVSTVVAVAGGRWLVGDHPLRALDPSGRLRHAGYGPCPVEPELRSRCPAVVTNHRLPRPAQILSGAAAAGLGALLFGLAAAGRLGRRELPRLRLVATILGASWVTARLILALAWGELDGSAPVLLLAAAILALLSPAFPVRHVARPEADEAPSPRLQQAWVTERVDRRSAVAAGARRLEVIRLPSGS